jgi:hypothetical protein
MSCAIVDVAAGAVVVWVSADLTSSFMMPDYSQRAVSPAT